MEDLFRDAVKNMIYQWADVDNINDIEMYKKRELWVPRHNEMRAKYPKTKRDVANDPVCLNTKKPKK